MNDLDPDIVKAAGLLASYQAERPPCTTLRCPHQASELVCHPEAQVDDPGDPFCTDCTMNVVLQAKKAWGIQLKVTYLDGTPLDDWDYKVLHYDPS